MSDRVQNISVVGSSVVGSSVAGNSAAGNSAAGSSAAGNVIEMIAAAVSAESAHPVPTMAKAAAADAADKSENQVAIVSRAVRPPARIATTEKGNGVMNAETQMRPRLRQRLHLIHLRKLAMIGTGRTWNRFS